MSQENGKLHMRHTGGGMLCLYDGDDLVREIGVTPGWDFKDRDEVIVRFNEYNREALRAATPASAGGGSLRVIAKRNLQRMIEIGSTDKATMLSCLEELS